MNVIFLSHHGCARMVKEAVALLKAGHAVHCVQHEIANTENKYVLPNLSFYNTREGLRAHLTCRKDIDIIHVHNTPDWLVTEARAACPDAAIVYDVHDMDSVRYQLEEPEEEEVAAYREADGYVFPSRSYSMTASLGVHTDAMLGKPVSIVYTMVNEEMLRRDRKALPMVGGVVYEGGLSHPEDDQYWPWLDFGWIAKSLCDDMIPFHVYGLERYRESYSAMGAVYHGVAPFSSITRELSRYTCGLVGTWPHHPQQEMAMPNKLFEYLAAGLPVIVVGNESEAGHFVETEGVGRCVKTPAEISKAMIGIERLKPMVWEKSITMTMESQVPKIINLYQDVIARKMLTGKVG